MTLTDAQLIRIGRTIAAGAMLLAVGGLIFAIVIGRWQSAVNAITPVNATVGIGFGALAWAVLPKQPRNRSVWAYTVAAFFGGLYSTALVPLVLAIPARVEATAGDLIPAELAWQAAIAAGVLSTAWIPSFLLPLTIGLLLFPNGQVPSPRWRWALRFQATTLGLGFLFASAANSPWSTGPVPQPGGTLGDLAEVFITLALLSSFLGIASLIVRYRDGDAVIRHQIRWIASGGAFVVVSELAKRLIWGGDTKALDPAIEILITLIPLMLLIASFWVAVAKYRLYEIDVIISKSVTYLGMGAVITALYVLVVLGPLLIVGESGDGGPGLLLPILATGTVAIVFEPVRVRMQRIANRLVYGQRATPHEVLSQIAARLADTKPGGGTNDLARLLAGGTGADEAVVWLRSADTFTPDGVWLRDGTESSQTVPVDALPNNDTTLSHLVVHRDEVFGAVTIVKPRTDPVAPGDRELLTDVAAGSGLLLRNIRLNRELLERAREVRESRRRLIAAQDAERHRLERDLHDGAQQRVVALKVKLGIARTIAQREGADAIAERLTGLSTTAQRAVDDLRAVAHGIYPPLLESEGLEAALRAAERKSTIATELNVHGLNRYGRSIEETVYFCVTEILERAHMSGAISARVGVASRNGELVAEILLGNLETELDLAPIIDRLDAAGGVLTVTDSPSERRSIIVSLPLATVDRALA